MAGASLDILISLGGWSTPSVFIDKYLAATKLAKNKTLQSEIQEQWYSDISQKIKHWKEFKTKKLCPAQKLIAKSQLMRKINMLKKKHTKPVTPQEPTPSSPPQSSYIANTPLKARLLEVTSPGLECSLASTVAYRSPTHESNSKATTKNSVKKNLFKAPTKQPYLTFTAPQNPPTWQQAISVQKVSQYSKQSVILNSVKKTVNRSDQTIEVSPRSPSQSQVTCLVHPKTVTKLPTMNCSRNTNQDHENKNKLQTTVVQRNEAHVHTVNKNKISEQTLLKGTVTNYSCNRVHVCQNYASVLPFPYHIVELGAFWLDIYIKIGQVLQSMTAIPNVYSKQELQDLQSSHR